MANIKKFEFSTSDAIDSRKSITSRMQDIVQGARDQNRELTEAEDYQLKQLDDLRKNWQEIEQKSSYLDDAAANSDVNFSNIYAGSQVAGATRSNTNNLFGELMASHYVNERAQGQYESRGITTSTAGAIIQDPFITDAYIGNLQHTNVLGSAGVEFSMSDTNYQQYAYASGEALVRAHGTESAALTADTSWSLASRKMGWFTRYIVFDVSYELQEDAPNALKQLGIEANTQISNDIQTNFFQGDGSATPLGLDSLTGINAIDLGGAAYDYDNVLDWMAYPKTNRIDENLSMVMGTNSWKTLGKLKGSDGHYITKPEALDQFQYLDTSAIREDYSTDKTKIYGGYFPGSRVIFSRGQMRIIYSRSQLGTNLTHRYICVSRYDNEHTRPAGYFRVDNVPTS